MGGINSGRRSVMFACERHRPLMEESSVLSIFALSRLGILKDGSSGILKWDVHSLSYWTRHSSIMLQYRTSGQDIQQTVMIGRIPLHWNNGTHKPCFICPQCERLSYKLYMAYGYTRFLCRNCYNIAYELQTMHYGGLPYRYTSIYKQCEKIRKQKQVTLKGDT